MNINNIYGIPYREIIKFLISGAFATIAHSIIFIYTVKIGILPIVSNALAFSIALTISFLMQSKWVFSAKTIEKIYLLKFGVTALFGLLSNTTIVFIVMNLLNKSEYMATIGIIIITPIITFSLNKFWVFTQRKNEYSKIKK